MIICIKTKKGRCTFWVCCLYYFVCMCRSMHAFIVCVCVCVCVCVGVGVGVSFTFMWGYKLLLAWPWIAQNNFKYITPSKPIPLLIPSLSPAINIKWGSIILLYILYNNIVLYSRWWWQWCTTVSRW